MMWLNAWKSDVKEMESKVRELKARLRNNWSAYVCKKNDKGVCAMDCRNHPGYDQESLTILKYQLTLLYQYRREHKGKVHVEVLPKKTFWRKSPDLQKYDKLKEDEKALQTISDLASLAQE